MVTKRSVETSERLEELVEKIRDSHQRCLKSLRASVDHARQTGNHLLEVQELVGKGKWLEWVQDNCEFSIAQAQRYKRIADRYSELLTKCKKPNQLTMTDALRLLSPGKDQAKAGKKTEDKRWAISSWEEVKEREVEAEEIQFAQDSPERTFVDEKAASIARQVLLLAKKSHAKDADNQPIDGLGVAIALIKKLKKALKVALVVRVAEPEPDEEARPKHRTESNGNGHKPHNRLNGKAKMPA